mgnify:CR=1 FL=1
MTERLRQRQKDYVRIFKASLDRRRNELKGSYFL